MRAFLSLVAIIAMSGCNQFGGGAYYPGTQSGAATPVVDTLLTTDAREYAMGAIVTVRFANRLGRALGYNLCRARLERFDADSQWSTVRTTLADVCTAEIRTLRPGQAVTYAFKAEPEGRWRAGDYRISADLEDLQARTRFAAVSNTFRLTRDGD